ncbi:hypothetical protein [Oceanobacillus kimchii]|uniref:hypothetical protein n=1 Tax=Oceanobacillus kimchii TaxID=746691 RepID=UPI0009860805|nr:hypothetical protein [Oceanobacillus kimchii]
MKNKKILLGVVALFTILVFSACSGSDETEPNNNENTGNETDESTEMDKNEKGSEPHGHMHHSNSGEVPEEI